MTELIFVAVAGLLFLPLFTKKGQVALIKALAAGSTSTSQSQMSSLIEQVLQVGTGFLISLLFWAYIIVPLWDIPVSFGDNLVITAMFTILSITRGYVFRRIFNRLTAIAHELEDQ